MRDRRNTNLSISSLSSVSSATSPVVAEAGLDDVEKGRFLWIHPATIGEPLPSPLLKHARESQETTTGRYGSCFGWKKVLLALALVTIFVCYHCSAWFTFRVPNQTPIPLDVTDKKYLFSTGDSLPQDPTPLIFQDEQGVSQWTVSIPRTLSFPLRPHQYRDLCQASEKISKSVESAAGWPKDSGRGHTRAKAYYAVDKTFVDVDEAESLGLLPHADNQSSVAVVGGDGGNNAKVCDKTLTFVMETENAGFGNTLLNLWMAYGLAKREGRKFFVDDTNWPYGKYDYYFPKPPQPSCAPPPAHQILPCPHGARHLVASSATLPWTFGSAFKDAFIRPRKSGVHRNREIFDMIRSGYDDLFGLVGEDASFLSHRLSDLQTAASKTGTPIVGMHIRRGDRHPFEVEFSNDYLPFDRYTSAAMAKLSSLATNLTASPDTPVSIFMASDDPDIYDSKDLVNTLPADVSVVRSQGRIVLASKKTLTPAVPLRNGAYTKHVDENSGWEGGFYSALFFGLGGGHPSATEATEKDLEIMKQAVSLRGLVGRGYLLDLAVLGHGDAVVCASSSAACRVLGIMLGWDKVADGQWSNVDAGRYWSWDGQL